MSLLRFIRGSKNLSQRTLARNAGVAFRTVQLMESGRHNPRWSTVRKLGRALGVKPTDLISGMKKRSSWESVRECSRKIVRDGTNSWKIHLMDLVDAFYRDGNVKRLQDAPIPQTPPKILALLASTTEALSMKSRTTTPWWCAGVPSLKVPWFVSDIESLKACALVESPVPFRQRNIFVLENFLSRV